jgi:hypothetical protein
MRTTVERPVKRPPCAREGCLTGLVEVSPPSPRQWDTTQAPPGLKPGYKDAGSQGTYRPCEACSPGAYEKWMDGQYQNGGVIRAEPELPPRNEPLEGWTDF